MCIRDSSEACERETLRMLQILRHLFFNSGDALALKMNDKKILQVSKVNTMNQSKKPKKEESIGEMLIQLWAQILEELGNNERYSEIIYETLRGAITFSS